MLLPKLKELQIRGRREEAHIRSVGGATIRCLYLSGERSLPFPARVAPPPFAPLRGALCQANARTWVLGRRMYHGRQSGGPKQKKWIENAAVAFRSFFGKRSGPPLPAAPSQPPSPLTGTPIITVNLAEVEGVNAGGTVHVLSLGDRVCLAPKPRSLTLSLILTLNLALRLNLTRTLTLTLEP